MAGWISYSLLQIADILLSVLITAHCYNSHFPDHLKIAIVALIKYNYQHEPSNLKKSVPTSTNNYSQTLRGNDNRNVLINNNQHGF